MIYVLIYVHIRTYRHYQICIFAHFVSSAPLFVAQLCLSASTFLCFRFKQFTYCVNIYQYYIYHKIHLFNYQYYFINLISSSSSLLAIKTHPKLIKYIKHTFFQKSTIFFRLWCCMFCPLYKSQNVLSKLISLKCLGNLRNQF